LPCMAFVILRYSPWQTKKGTDAIARKTVACH